MIKIEIAGLAVGIENRYSHIVRKARDYITEREADFTVSVSEDEIDREMKDSGTNFERGYYEGIISYRKIAEILPRYDAILFHGSVILVNGLAYIITANSGVGKTTHTRLWMSEFSDVKILNGDKPIVRFFDGVPYACGTPWQGKEGFGENIRAKLSAIAFLKRGEANVAKQIEPSDAVVRFMSQIYLPKKSAMALTKTMMLADKLIKNTRLVELECNMQPEAAHVCRAELIV